MIDPNKLKTIAQNYSPHPSSVGWGSMCILYSPYEADGHITYSTGGGCYDSNHKRTLSYTSGLSGTCDVCGAHFTGTEGYENQWFGNVSCCSDQVRNTPGSTNTCPGHTITGVGGVTIGSFKCQYKNDGGDVYVRYIVTPASGYASSISTSDWCKCSKADRSDFTAYTYPYTAVFTKGGVNVASVGLRYYYMLNDNTRPTAYSYVNDSTANSYWKVEGNGSSDSISTHLRLTATFSDPDQFSYNRVSIRLFDADGVTPIRHSNGDVLLPLVRISGSAGTSGSSALWKGTIDVKAEVKGAKQIYVQAVDSSGNASEKMPMAIMYVDSQGPDITVTDSGNLNSWSNEKTITVTAIDAFDDVWLGVSSEDLKLISVDEYNNTRTYRITGDMNGSKNVAFFARDKVGNVTSKVITFSKLDNTAPSITSVTQSDIITGGHATGWKITATGADHGSGISGTALVKGDREPEASDYSNTYVYEVTRSGDYYIWMKDNVGNTSKSAKIHIRSDVTYNGTEVNEIEFNGTDLDCLYYGDKRLRL